MPVYVFKHLKDLGPFRFFVFHLLGTLSLLLVIGLFKDRIIQGIQLLGDRFFPTVSGMTSTMTFITYAILWLIIFYLPFQAFSMIYPAEKT